MKNTVYTNAKKYRMYSICLDMLISEYQKNDNLYDGYGDIEKRLLKFAKQIAFKSLPKIQFDGIVATVFDDTENVIELYIEYYVIEGNADGK